MGLTVTPDAVVPVSTGAVKFNDDYQRPIEFDPAGPSTGVASLADDPALGETIVAHLGADVEVRYPAPDGPVTAEQWPGPGDALHDGAVASDGGVPAVTTAPPAEPTQARPPRRSRARKPAAPKAKATTKAKASTPTTTKVVKPTPKRAPKSTGGATTKSRR